MTNLPLWFPVASLLLVVAASILRGLLLQASGVPSYGFGHNRPIQSVAERFWSIAVALLAVAALTAWLAPQLEIHLGRPAWSDTPSLRWIAAGLMTVCTALIIAAQATMGASWRVSVPAEGPGALVTGGLFAISRNPVFVGMFGLALGMFLWSPTMLTAALLPLAASMMAVQVRIEEDALSARHGDDYAAYQKSTPRWL
jgi:protein-S-isoprenylcysteine O-methyltransferase Ste14